MTADVSALSTALEGRYRVAHELGWPCVTGVKNIEISDGSPPQVRARREYAGREEVFELPLRIGSGRENDIVIVRDGVSRNHCLLQREGRTVVLVDTNSEFGTFVNGARVARHELEEDDVIRLGTEVELAFEGR